VGKGGAVDNTFCRRKIQKELGSVNWQFIPCGSLGLARGCLVAEPVTRLRLGGTVESDRDPLRGFLVIIPELRHLSTLFWVTRKSVSVKGYNYKNKRNPVLSNHFNHRVHINPNQHSK